MATTSTFQVAGMTCGHCVNAVETELAKIDGATAVHADFPSSGTVTTIAGVVHATADPVTVAPSDPFAFGTIQ